GSGSAPPAASATATPVGSLDLVNVWPSGAPQTVFGWAFDLDAPGGGAGPVQVRLDVDGTEGVPVNATLPRADLQAAVGSTNHGFLLTAPALAAGTHTLRVVALDIPTGA